LQVDEKVLKWIRHTKRCLLRGQEASFNPNLLRVCLYRPFTKLHYYADRIFSQDVYQFPRVFPDLASERENRVICCTNHTQIPFLVQMAGCIANEGVGGRSGQCFPFYTYAEDGSHRRENITDWALDQFHRRYPLPSDVPLSKWDIFHYVYAILHHPQYRAHYAANLRRELPRIPFAPDFHAFAAAGKQLADLHVGYEQAKEYPLTRREKPDTQLNWRVEKMKLTRDKTSLVYNDFLTLEGIPPGTYEYRLGNRSALEWVIDQFQVSTDKRSGITNDPNRPDDPQYIVRLIAQVITVSLETVKIVRSLPPMQTD
jgi:predicted helicase